MAVGGVLQALRQFTWKVFAATAATLHPKIPAWLYAALMVLPLPPSMAEQTSPDLSEGDVK